VRWRFVVVESAIALSIRIGLVVIDRIHVMSAIVHEASRGVATICQDMVIRRSAGVP
jgi:hypothetical protein